MKVSMLPVICITGYLDDETKEKAWVTESYEYLVKPVTGMEIKSSIELALHVHRTLNP